MFVLLSTVQSHAMPYYSILQKRRLLTFMYLMNIWSKRKEKKSVPKVTFLKFIYLAVPGLSCGMRDLSCGFPDQGWNPGSLPWEHEVLATGPPGKCPLHHLFKVSTCEWQQVRVAVFLWAAYFTCPLGSSASHVAVSPSFYGWVTFHSAYEPPFLSPFFLSCFCNFSVVNDAAMNMGCNKPSQVSVLISSDKYPQMKLPGRVVILSLIFQDTLSVFLSDCTNIDSYQQCTWVPSFPAF